MLAKDGTDTADDARDVVVADGDEGAVEGSLDVDAVVAEEAQRGSVKNGGRGAGVAIRRVKDELQHRAYSAGCELLLVFLNANAAFLSDGRGIDAIGCGALAVGAIEDAGDGGVADEIRFAGGEA